MEITKLLGLEEEILTETPAKFQAPSTVIDYDLNDQTVRKAVVVSSSPIQCVRKKKTKFISGNFKLNFVLPGTFYDL